MKTYIYARISKEELNHENQIHILKQKFPEAEIIVETVSGAAKEKPILNALLARIRRNDVIAVYALDRIGRTGGEAITLVKNLLEKGIKVYSYRENFDFTTAIGEYMSGQMLLFAQLERRLISERTKNALSRLKSEGKKLGPPPKFNQEKIQAIKEHRQNGLTIREIHKITNVSTGRICQILKAV